MNWESFKTTILSIYDNIENCNKENWISTYTYIYNFFNKSFSRKKIILEDNIEYEDFYNKIISLIDNILDNILSNINNCNIDILLSVWHKNITISKIINNIYSYFNKSYICKHKFYRKEKFEYFDSFIIRWKHKVMDKFNFKSEILIEILQV